MMVQPSSATHDLVHSVSSHDENMYIHEPLLSPHAAKGPDQRYDGSDNYNGSGSGNEKRDCKRSHRSNTTTMTTTTTAAASTQHSFDLKFLVRLWGILLLSATTLKSSGMEEGCGTERRGRRWRWYSLKRSLTAVCVSLAWPLLLVVCFVGEMLLANEVGMLSARFSVAIIEHVGDGSASQFIHVLWVGLLLIMATNVAKTMRQFVQDAMTISWRGRLTRNIHIRYFADRTFYRMVVLENRVDNPDHRITIDVNHCVRKIVDILANLMNAPMNIVFYTVATYRTIGWQGPVTCYAFFLVGSILNKILISPVVSLRFAQEREEGNFRFAHVSLRTHAETVAFYNGAEREHDIADSLLQRAISNLWKIAGRMFLLNFHMNLFGYLGAILAYGILGVGAFAFGVFEGDTPQDIVYKIQTFSFQCIMLIYGFTQFIQIGSDASELAGHTARVGDMLEEFNRIQSVMKSKKQSTPDRSTSLSSAPSSADYIAFQGVTIRTPSSSSSDRITLLENVSFKINPGEHTLIVGPSGSGKSSILRVLAGLWELEKGDGLVCSPHHLFYIAQTAYTVLGTLRDQVTYPIGTRGNARTWMGHDVDRLVSREEEEGIIKNALERARLGYLLKNVPSLDFSCNWDNVLSGGERQRLSFARLFFYLELSKRTLEHGQHQHQQHIFVIMDESTNALDIDVERLLFEEMNKEKNLTMVTVGHRLTLFQYHRFLMEIDPLSRSCAVRSVKEPCTS